MSLPSLMQRISNAKSALNAIARHPDFEKVINSGFWDDEDVGLSGAVEMLERLLEVYQSMQEDFE